MLAVAVLLTSSTLRSLRNARAANESVALLEFFTSEGCSSCPNAEKVVEKLSEQYKGRVLVLAFHVDYWNRLGWVDEFSDATYSKRQEQYAGFLKTYNIYTPQVVLNGKSEWLGTAEAELSKAIDAELSKKNPASIQLSVAANNGKTILVKYNRKGGSDELVGNVALVQLQATTQVKAGENKDRSLSQINIVRDFKTGNANKNQQFELKLPANSDAKNFVLIAFAQEPETGRITGATQMSL